MVPPRRRIGFRAMGCGVTITVEETKGHAPIERLPAWFRSCEQVLSRFCPDSELSMLNRNPDRPTATSALLWHAMMAALVAAEWTDGLVHPALLAALENSGYDRDFAQIAAAGDANAILPAVPAAVPARDWHDIGIDPAHHAITLPSGMRIDLGGTVKGWIADEVARALAPHGPALVCAGGDIAISGPPQNGGWRIAVGSPLRHDRPLGLIEVRRGGVATSGRDHRRWRRAEAWQHHLIDPSTGRPSTTDVLSATVVGPSAFHAEVAAKAVLLRGSADGLAWLATQPGFAGLIVTESGGVATTENFAALWVAEHRCDPVAC